MEARVRHAARAVTEQPPPTVTDLPAGAARMPSAAFLRWSACATAQPWRYDFYQVLRRIESAHPWLPRLGEAQRPADEPVRLAQPAELTFPPAPVHALSPSGSGVLRLSQRVFGLTGPNGPLPTHLTELARDRAHQYADPTLQRFFDVLAQRFGLLFYRAWAQAQPVVSLDRPRDDTFARRLGSLLGIGAEATRERDASGDAPKLYFAGHLARHVRDADGLLSWCRARFGVPVRIEQWCGHWMRLDREERTRLGTRRGLAAAQALGRGAVLGSAVWDVQHKFRIVIGPLAESRYHAFLPGGQDLARLQAMVRQWVGLEFEWDLRLILARAEVPRIRLGRSGEIGRSAWVGRWRHARDAGDLVIDVERTLRRPPSLFPQKEPAP